MSVRNINYLRAIIQRIGYASEILIISVLLGLGLDAKQSGLAQQPPAPQPEAAPVKVEELEINVYGERLLNKPIYSPLP